MKEHAERIELELPLTEEYGGGFLPFHREREHMFLRGETHFFSQLDRYKILQSLISSKERSGGAGLSPLAPFGFSAAAQTDHYSV